MSNRLKSTRRELTSEASRRDIINAAIRLISEHGLSSVSIRDIAEEANISDSSVFFFFGNREGLLKGVARELQMRGGAEVSEVLANESLDAVQKVTALIDVVLGWAQKSPEFFVINNIFVQERQALPVVASADLEARAARRAHFAGPIREAIDAGLIRPVDVGLFLDLLFVNGRGLVIQTTNMNEPQTKELIAMARQSLLAVLGLS